MRKDVYLILALFSFVMMSGDSSNFLTWVLWEIVWGFIGVTSLRKVGENYDNYKN